jgi:hypothetical protein
MITQGPCLSRFRDRQPTSDPAICRSVSVSIFRKRVRRSTPEPRRRPTPFRRTGTHVNDHGVHTHCLPRPVGLCQVVSYGCHGGGGRKGSAACDFAAAHTGRHDEAAQLAARWEGPRTTPCRRRHRGPRPPPVAGTSRPAAGPGTRPAPGLIAPPRTWPMLRGGRSRPAPTGTAAHHAPAGGPTGGSILTRDRGGPCAPGSNIWNLRADGRPRCRPTERSFAIPNRQPRRRGASGGQSMPATNGRRLKATPDAPRWLNHTKGSHPVPHKNVGKIERFGPLATAWKGPLRLPAVGWARWCGAGRRGRQWRCRRASTLTLQWRCGAV